MFNITSVAFGGLLHFPCKFHPEIPRDPQTPLKMTRAISVNQCCWWNVFTYGNSPQFTEVL
jgi:hypothetical protein